MGFYTGTVLAVVTPKHLLIHLLSFASLVSTGYSTVPVGGALPSLWRVATQCTDKAFCDLLGQMILFR